MNEDFHQLKLLGSKTAPPLMAFGGSQSLYAAALLKRDDSSNAGSSLPLVTIIAIVIGTSLMVFSVFGTWIVISCLRRKHRRQGDKFLQTVKDGHVDVDLTTARTPTNPGLPFSQRLSLNSFLPSPHTSLAQGRSEKDTAPHLLKAKRSSSDRPFFRVSSIRDSWPLSSKNIISLGVLPNQSPMVLSPVAPPGYVIQDRGPNRACSRLSRRESGISVTTAISKSPRIAKQRSSSQSSPVHSPASSPSKSPSRFSIEPPTSKMLMPPVILQNYHIQEMSETQVLAILQSTSQRLKVARRDSLSGHLTTISKFPNVQQPGNLLTPPRRLSAESREEITDRDYSDSLRSSLLECYMNRTPSPRTDMPFTTEKSMSDPRSPAPSIRCKDGPTTPDIGITTPLDSQKNSPRRGKWCHEGKSPAGNVGNLLAVVPKEIQTTQTPWDDTKQILMQPEINAPIIPRHMLLTVDPFYPSVRSSKLIIPSSRTQGPRPMHSRKTTFGHVTTSNRLASLHLPVRESIGNVQSLPNESVTFRNSSRESSPGGEKLEGIHPQLSTQESLNTRLLSRVSTSPKDVNSHHDHESSKTAQNLGPLPRPSTSSSTFETVDEEFESFKLKLKLPVPQFTGRKSLPPITAIPSPSALSSQRHSKKLSSSLKSEPTKIVSHSAKTSLNGSPNLALEDMSAAGSYYPPLSVCDYYADDGNGSIKSGNEICHSVPLTPLERPISRQSLSRTSKSPTEGERCPHSYSVDLISNSIQIHSPDKDPKSWSFPYSQLVDPEMAILSSLPDAAKPLSNIILPMTGTATPTLAVLTAPLPSERTSMNSSVKPEDLILLSGQCPTASRHSLLASINLLRRMNSDVSQCSCFSTPGTETSPIFISQPAQVAISPLSKTATLVGAREGEVKISKQEDSQGRGSKHYLSLGSRISISSYSMPYRPKPTETSTLKSAPPCDHEDVRVLQWQPKDSHKMGKEWRRRAAEILGDEEGESDNLPSPGEKRPGGHIMDWEFDDSDPGIGVMSNCDMKLTTVKEVAKWPGTEESNQFSQIGCQGSGDNPLGILGLHYPVLNFETESGDNNNDANSVTAQETFCEPAAIKKNTSNNLNLQNKENAKRNAILGFGFEAFKPALDRSPSLRLSEPIVASQTPTTANLTEERCQPRWSDIMAKPATLVARRESKMEHPAPRPRWELSVLGIQELGLVAAKILGSTTPRLSLIRSSASGGGNGKEGGRPGVESIQNMTVEEEVEFHENTGWYDQEDILNLSDSPSQEMKQRENEKEEVKVMTEPELSPEIKGIVLKTATKNLDG